LLFSTTTYSYVQDTLKLKKGTIISGLKVPSSEGTYSVYLPTFFDVNKEWPILLGFNSKNKQHHLANLFSSSAEEFGYIIVVSDYAKKTSVLDRTNYVSRLIKYLGATFPIQDKRMYAFGIGEDAIFTSSLPLGYKEFDGAISIGNGYNYKRTKLSGMDFSYLGMIGNKNFRYQRFIRTNKYLKRKKIISDVYIYEGNDELPPEKIIQEALPYFTLAAMAKGKAPKDSAWIMNQYEMDLKEVDALKNTGAYLKAYEKLIRVENNYQQFFDIEEIKKYQKEIKKADAYKKEKRLRSKYDNREVFLLQNLLFSLEEDVNYNQYDNLGWWQFKMEELDKLTNSKEEYAGNMVFRIRGGVKNVLSEYKKTVSKEESELDKKIFLNILSTIIDKNDFESYRNVISLSTRDQDPGTAIFYLEKMLQNGYTDMESLYTIEGTLALRVSKEYNKVIKKYLGASKYYMLD